MSRKPVMLIILDGWGIRSTEHGNAVAQAHTPNFDRWLQTCERTIVHSSGEHVGLVTGQMGKFRSWTSQPGRWTHRLSGYIAYRQRHRGRHTRRERHSAGCA